MGRILVGTASWTDPSLVKSGDFYPPGANSAEEMLRYYAGQFPLVEVDSSYYALPSERNARLWVERTPDGFTFDVKAFALMTMHPADVRRLPKDIQGMLPPEAQDKARVYPRDVPQEGLDLVWERFDSAVRPLREAGKLGAVFFQFPKWFPISSENKDYILECKSKLSDCPIAVEFRQHTWFKGDNIEETLEFLDANKIAYTAVDEPQGFPSSVPPIAAVTSDELAVVRMHGRNAETWEKRGLPPSEKYKYLYTEAELDEWADRVVAMAKEARQVHVLFNNNYGSYAVRNAAQMKLMLGDQAFGQ